MKIKAILTIIIILAVIVTVIVAAVAVSGGVGGNKVTIVGTVYYNIITGWGVTYDDYLVEEDSFISLPLWYWPWETKDIEVVVEMSNGKTYSSSTWTDKINLIIGSSVFNIDLHHVAEGEYTGTIYVYEVEKELLWGEKSRVLQATTSFGVTV